MSEKILSKDFLSKDFLSKDFLSKENISQLYKEITIVNEYNNLNKQQKDFIINNLIEIMKRIYKTLDYTKINTNNITNIKKQYNSIVVKQTSELIKSTLNKSDNTQNQRTIDITLNSIKNPPISITSIDRPLSSINNQPIIPAQMKVSDDFIKKTSGDVATRLAELENSRRTNNFNKPTDVPDFLKPTKVGKEEIFQTSNNSNSNFKERKLEGFGDLQDNFKDNNNNNFDMSKYNDNMSIQDRLQKLEAERGNQYQPIPVQQSQSQPPIQNQYQPPPIQNQYQPPPVQNQYQPPVQTQYQPPVQNQYQQSDEIFQQLNEMKMMLKTLKEENDYLKNKTKQQSIKTLQLDINKTTSLYKFQFNPINNIVSLKLLSYNLPQPVYNIFDSINFIYEMNDIQHQIVIPKGNYTIEMLLNNMNNNNNLIFSIDYTQKVSVKSKDGTTEFKIKQTYISFKLGFIEDQLSINKTAQKIFDLRLPSKLLLYIKNINQNPICILNFNNTSVCNLQFNSPLTLSSLDLEFYTEDNILYNFNDIPYNLSFALDILE